MNKTKCEYCGGVTQDDYLGNCSACGAPRNENNVMKYANMGQTHNPHPTFGMYGIYGGGVAFGICSTSGEMWLSST